jgi:hypothetical protein
MEVLRYFPTILSGPSQPCECRTCRRSSQVVMIWSLQNLRFDLSLITFAYTYSRSHTSTAAYETSHLFEARSTTSVHLLYVFHVAKYHLNRKERYTKTRINLTRYLLILTQTSAYSSDLCTLQTEKPPTGSENLRKKQTA